ncbi:response regulator [Legionella geestiana]|nr:response regulator [Legionella geestiana]
MEKSMDSTVIGDDAGQRDALLKYYRDIITCLPNYVYIVDANCQLTEANTEVLKLLGVRNVAALSGSFYARLTTHSCFSEERIARLHQDDINALLEGRRVSNEQEAPFVDRDGNILYFSSIRTPIRNAEGVVIALVVVLVDINAQKALAQHLEELALQKKRMNGEARTHALPPSVYRDPQKPPKVLIIEDNEMALKAVRATLLQLDCIVDTADSAHAAAAQFKPGKYDFVLMDIGFEDNSGYVIAKNLRKIEEGTNYHVPIIALTGFDAEIVREDCLYYSMEGAITKPLSALQAKQIIGHYVYNRENLIEGLKN